LSSKKHLILGSAGHIDHGKTTLVAALTGKNTDRLPEEKKRGITIELGFAHLSVGDYDFGIVDVPGHQKFIKTMLAGSTGVDVVMLVVAADDSVNRQTREHLEILRYLDVPSGVIAITKCDLAEESWVEMVEEEVRDLAQGTFLEDAPIIRTSSIKKTGLDELKAALEAVADVSFAARAKLENEPFRMPIDRVFSVEGHGTIVTGSVTHGALEVGQNVQLIPEFSGREIRVRQIQTHDKSVERAVRGQRAAINLVGTTVDEIRRGFQISAADAVCETTCVTAKVAVAADFVKGLANHSVVSIHLGTMEAEAKVRLLGPEIQSDSVIPPGESGLVQLMLRKPVAASWNGRLVLRRPSPATTIASAVILDPGLHRLGRLDQKDVDVLEQLEGSDFSARLTAHLYFNFSGQIQTSEITRRTSIPADQIDWSEVEKTTTTFQVGQNEFRFHPLRLSKTKELIQKVLGKEHDANPKRLFIDNNVIKHQFRYLPDPVVRHLLKEMQSEKILQLSPMGIGLVGRGPVLTKNQQKLVGHLLDWFKEDGLAPPTVKNCVDRADKNKQDVPDLIKMMVDSGDLVDIGNEIYLAKTVFDQAWDKVAGLMADGQGHNVSQIKDELGITRKIAIPLCEFFDDRKLTRRDGDLRFLGEAAEVAST